VVSAVKIRGDVAQSDCHGGLLLYASNGRNLRSSTARFELGDFTGGIAVATSALALAQGLVAANPDDVMSRSLTAQARQIGHNERGLARRAAARDRRPHQLRACAAYGHSLDAYRKTIATGRGDAADRTNAEDLETLRASCRVRPADTRAGRPR
jgi:hypothetical protein